MPGDWAVIIIVVLLGDPVLLVSSRAPTATGNVRKSLVEKLV